MSHGKVEVPLDSKEDLELIADKLLKKSGVYGVLPTPLNDLSEHAGVTCVNELPEKEAFLKTLTEKGKRKFESAIQSIRGIADLRDKVIYIPQGKSNDQERFAHAHEIAHQSIDWHNIGDPHIDTQYNFKPSVQKIIEREANYLGAELLYQGDHFKHIALDYTASMSTALMLADEHGASKHATLLKLVQIQDEKICVAEYYPTKKGCPSKGFKLYKTVGSSNFFDKISNIELPPNIDTDHDWYEATGYSAMPEGTIDLIVDGHKRTFEWSAWFNQYTLFVMLRDKPKLHRIGRIIRPNREIIKPKAPLLEW